VKTIRMTKEFHYRPHRRAVIVYKAGAIYERVPEAAVSDILKAGACEIVREPSRLPVNRYA
jgi:hypothetical protein